MNIDIACDVIAIRNNLITNQSIDAQAAAKYIEGGAGTHVHGSSFANTLSCSSKAELPLILFEVVNPFGRNFDGQ